MNRDDPNASPAPMTSVLSFPDRGPWGRSSWRGNTSGHVYRELFQQFKPKFFCDPMVGSGTSIDVARELGVRAVGLDLHQGFNILRSSILQAIGGEPADMIVSHPPYGDMIRYSGEVWGNAPHPDDLSRCASHEEFLDKLQVALLNQRSATCDGGLYGTLIGDLRRNGQYHSYQANLIARMPASELASVIIKLQHNVTSNRSSYARLAMPRIQHEYLILWKRPEVARSVVATLCEMATQGQRQVRSAWFGVVRNAMIGLGGKAHLDDIYQQVEPVAKTQHPNNRNVEAKVRQVLQTYKDFASCGDGVWALAA